MASKKLSKKTKELIESYIHWNYDLKKWAYQDLIDALIKELPKSKQDEIKLIEKQQTRYE